LREKSELLVFDGKERKLGLTSISTTKIVDLDANEFYLVKEFHLSVFSPSNYLKNHIFAQE
jgi:hypothetical protein